MVDQNIITVDSYTAMNLYDQGVYEELVDLHRDVLDAPFESARFYKNITRMLQTQRTELESRAPELIPKYDQMAQAAAVAGLPFLTDEAVLSLFENKPLDVMRSNFDAQEQLRIFLSGHYVMEERNALREKLRSALESSLQPLGSEASQQLSQPLDTVSKWLAYRNQILGPVSESDLLADKQFLAQDKNVKLLSSEQQAALFKLLAVYRWLHLSSLWQEGLEEHIVLRENGRLKILRNGVLEDLVQPSVFVSEERSVVGNKSNLPPTTLATKQTPIMEPVADYLDESTSFTKIDNKPTPDEREKELFATPSKTEHKSPELSNTEFIHSSPQTFKSTSPALVFNIEDEKEADKHRDKAGAPPVLEHVLRAFVDEVIKVKNLVFKDEVNQRRFIQLMVSRLKDVRGPLEVAEVLRKSIEVGGLGMPEEKASQVQTIMEEAKRDFEKRVKEKALNVPELVAEKLPTSSIKTTSAKPSFDEEAARAWREQMLREIQAQTQPAVAATSQPAPLPKPQLADVKAPPKVVGPLEELRSLSLVDFRRLGTTPQEALKKIKGKIDLLGENSIARRVEAVRAWKSSSLYQQYLRLGQESIEQGASVSVVVGNHQNLGDAVLTENEFTAIADFNSQLRF